MAHSIIRAIIVWESSYKVDEKTLAAFDQYLQEYVYEKTWAKFSNNDKKVLFAFDSENANDVSTLMTNSKMEKPTFSVYRDRLIKRGNLLASGHGELKIALPRFYSFLRIMKEY